MGMISFCRMAEQLKSNHRYLQAWSQTRPSILTCDRREDFMRGQKSIAALILRRGAESVAFDEIPRALEARGEAGADSTEEDGNVGHRD